MGDRAAEDVVFDFEGSMELARRLWRSADELEAVGVWRFGAGERALASWRGRYASEFVDRANDESAGTAAVVSGLRSEAMQWVQAWVSSREEQNRIVRARAVKEERDNRSWSERNLGDHAVGDDSDSQILFTPCLMSPQPPHFEDPNPVYRP